MELSIRSIEQWERGERVPGALELAKLCRALAVPCDVLHAALLTADPTPPPAIKKKRRGRPPSRVRKDQSGQDKSA